MQNCSPACRTQIGRRGKSEKLSRAMDKINHRFGPDSILTGMTPSQGQSFSGSKIAFTRIPDVDEFLNRRLLRSTGHPHRFRFSISKLCVRAVSGFCFRPASSLRAATN
jgi:hypothetical protein